MPQETFMFTHTLPLTQPKTNRVAPDVEHRFAVVWKYNIGKLRTRFTRDMKGDADAAERAFMRWAKTQHLAGRRFDHLG